MEKNIIKLPTNALSDQDIIEYCTNLNITNFRFVCMLDELPKRPLENESAIINLNSHTEPGSHWVAIIKIKRIRLYFDSYGEIPPPEIVKYLKTPSEYKLNKFVIKYSI